MKSFSRTFASVSLKYFGQLPDLWRSTKAITMHQSTLIVNFELTLPVASGVLDGEAMVWVCSERSNDQEGTGTRL